MTAAGSAALRRLRPILVRLARPPRLGGARRGRDEPEAAPQVVVWRGGSPEPLAAEDARAGALIEAADRLLSAAQRRSDAP